MGTKLMRKIVKIDEEKCNGCGICIPACVEGALQIIEGKARLVSDKYCDGLGACLGECPQDAITVEEREAENFDEAAALRHAEQSKQQAPAGCSVCPSAVVAGLERADDPAVAMPEARSPASALGHWPFQLALVPPGAPFLKGADVVLSADCVPFSYPDFHRDFLKDHALLVACPKLDDFQAHQLRLAEILRRSDIKSLTVIRMEVPCCGGLRHMVTQAMRMSGTHVPLKEVIIGIKGERKS